MGQELEMGVYLILSGGDIEVDFAKSFIESHSFEKVVCADKGLERAMEFGLLPNVVLGDFDSVNPTLFENFRKEFQDESQVEFISYPSKKDLTDTHIALLWALEQGAKEVVILGATGGRLDHFLGNVHILMEGLVRKVPVSLVDAKNRISLVNDTCYLKKETVFGKYISLIPFTEKVEGITIKGLAYEMENGEMVIGKSLGISNEFDKEAKKATITIKKGILIVVESKD